MSISWNSIAQDVCAAAAMLSAVAFGARLFAKCHDAAISANGNAVFVVRNGRRM